MPQGGLPNSRTGAAVGAGSLRSGVPLARLPLDVLSARYGIAKGADSGLRHAAPRTTSDAMPDVGFAPGLKVIVGAN